MITAMATLSRADVEHVAHLARLGLTDEELTRLEGAAQPHPRPVRDPRHARHRRHPAHGPDDRAGEHPARRRRPAVAAGRRGARQRPRPRRRPLRRPGDPRRRCRGAVTMASRSLTRLAAHEMAGRPAGRRVSVPRAGRGPPRGRRARQPRPQRLARRSTARARSPRPTPPTPGWPRPARTARTPSPRSTRCAACRSPSRTSSPCAGGQCTAGSRILAGYVGPFDAHITERLRDAGAVILGKTQHGRVRHGLLDGALGLRADGEPVGPRPRARRQLRRVGRGRCRVPRPARASARTRAARSASRPRCAGSSG